METANSPFLCRRHHGILTSTCHCHLRARASCCPYMLSSTAAVLWLTAFWVSRAIESRDTMSQYLLQTVAYRFMTHTGNLWSWRALLGQTPKNVDLQCRVEKNGKSGGDTPKVRNKWKFGGDAPVWTCLHTIWTCLHTIWMWVSDATIFWVKPRWLIYHCFYYLK